MARLAAVVHGHTGDGLPDGMSMTTHTHYSTIVAGVA